MKSGAALHTDHTMKLPSFSRTKNARIRLLDSTFTKTAHSSQVCALLAAGSPPAKATCSATDIRGVESPGTHDRGALTQSLRCAC